jgi:LuxR family transcriptional regulator, maltose regulon positive regulatory protein
MSIRLRTQTDPALMLKSTPPRAVRGFLERSRLSQRRLETSGAPFTALLAPSGFGKTAQLVSWRREALTRGALAFWYTVDAQDEPLRLIQGLTHAAKAACGKRGFDDDFMAWMANCVDPQEATTGWLAEVAKLSVEALLLLDDVELMPIESRHQVLRYLLGNAPPNVSVVIAARSSGALLASGALGLVPVTRVLVADLRFRPEETVAVLSAALGARCNADACVRLHEITEGWPLGVQLAVGALVRGGDIDSLINAASSDIQRYFVDAVIDHQTADATHLLVRAARFSLIHPQLCADVLGSERYSEELLRLQDETPLLLRAEGESWMRLHPLAREVLEARLAALSGDELSALSRKASAWYATRQLFEEAAGQAFLAGDVAEALSLIEQSTAHMTVQGRSGAVLSWYERLSPQEVRERPSFWGPAAWALAMSDRHAEAQPLLDLMLGQPGVADGVRFEVMLIGATAASFADRFDVVEKLLAQWPEPPLDALPGMLPIYSDAKAHLMTLQGQPDHARLMYARIGRLDRVQSYSPVSYGLAAFGTGIAYLWEGRASLAEEVLRPALARAEERLRRQHPVACMLAAALAQACWETGLDDEALSLLAGRMSTLEAFGMPDALMAAFGTLACIAEHEGRQSQGLSLLEALRAIGQARGMIRLQVMAQSEIVRMHASHGRADIARSMSAELDALIRSGRVPPPAVFVPWVQLHVELSRARALLSAGDGALVPQVLQAAESAASLAASMKRTGDLVDARLLCAEALHRRGAADARSVKNEALSLAQAEGMVRRLREHGARRDAAHAMPASPAEIGIREPQVLGRGLLTAKEREVLALLNRNLSNKEIGLAMSVGEQTVKWHVKNVFNKLNAANRKHAVARARLLGLIDA